MTKLENIVMLRANSYDALPSIFACCEANPCADFDENEMVLMGMSAQRMFERNSKIIQRLLSADVAILSADEALALSWLMSAAQVLASRIERFCATGHLSYSAEIDTDKHAVVPVSLDQSDWEAPF